ncbi:metallophosphoesterase [Novosphingobium sp.]|uniref:metallophosphoesterase family protein n=1 Tax=Novosphingobium sp. TaxID=1874826 RepID=UPI0025DD7933|nr:metallophosphoesterase [Novosphingobium sp.]
MTPDLTFFHISDLHFGREDRGALQWVRDAIALEKPDAVLITGDLTMRARTSEFDAACAWISDLGVPVTVEVGNHDLPYFNLWERFTDPYRRYHAIERLIERELGFPGFAVVPLRTTTRAQWRWPWVDGWVREPALAQTLAAIDALPAETRVLVTAHHPLPERSPEGKHLTIGGTRAMAELARRGVAAVLTGHVHDPFDLVQETAQGHLRMIGAGTLSTRLRSTPPSYNRIELAGSDVRVAVRNREHLATPQVQVGEVPSGPLPGETAAIA